VSGWIVSERETRKHTAAQTQLRSGESKFTTSGKIVRLAKGGGGGASLARLLLLLRNDRAAAFLFLWWPAMCIGAGEEKIILSLCCCCCCSTLERAAESNHLFSPSPQFAPSLCLKSVGHSWSTRRGQAQAGISTGELVWNSGNMNYQLGILRL